MGGRTFKLKFGHHGGNQPVVDLATRAVTITSQNHGFAVDPDSLPAGCVATEINLNDGTVEAFARRPAGRFSRCSTTPRRPPARTTRARSSAASSTSWRPRERGARSARA